MNGSILASIIETDMKREKYFKSRKRAKCVIDKEKQCRRCPYQNICDGVEYERDNSIESDKQNSG